MSRLIALLAASAGSALAEFACDAGAVSLPDSHVNDDYCDCLDGSDEPNTGACTNQPFVCQCKPHLAKTVFASRVNDGVCDCCDGADEWRSAACPNTCVDAAKAALETAQTASLKRAEREASGKKAKAERVAKLADARATLETSLAAVNAARAVMARAEEAEASRLAAREARLAANEVASVLKLGELSTELLGVVIARLALAKLVDGVDALHEALKGLPSIDAAMSDVDSADMIMVAMEAKEDASAPDCRAATAACGREAELLALLPLAQLPTAELIALVQSFAVSTGQVAGLVDVAGALLTGVGESLDGVAIADALSLLAPFADADADAARLKFQQLETTAASSNATVAELVPVAALDSDFGQSQQWYALHRRCYATALTPFKYNLCPFDKFTQDGRTLGSYAGWADSKQQRQQAAVGAAGGAAADVGGSDAAAPRMLFEDGEPCNGVPRQASVTFVCGNDDRLEAVTEPRTCVYEARFATPSACSSTDLRAQHEALAAAAEEAGLPYEPSPALRDILGL